MWTKKLKDVKKEESRKEAGREGGAGGKTSFLKVVYKMMSSILRFFHSFLCSFPLSLHKYTWDYIQQI